MGIEYAIIVKNKTRLESLIEQFNTKAQAKFYIERSGGNFSDYENEHEVFMESLAALQAQLSKVIKHKIVDRNYLPSYIFSSKNIIVVIGQDGLVANTAKYANGVPIVAVNPDKKRYDGILLPFNISNFIGGVENVLSGKFSVKKMAFAEARLNDGQRLLAFNDLFIGISGHVSARYKITYNNTTEEHSSSGIIVSTPAGATGWLSSVFNMAYGISGLFDNSTKPKHPALKQQQLLFAVREPFISVRTQAGMVTGIIDNSHLLTIESLMPANGIIFSDGIEKDFIHFNSGTTATIGLAKESATLVI